MITGLEERALFWVSAILYLGAFGFALAGLVRERRFARPVFNTLLVGGFLFQTLGLYIRGVHDQAFPVINYFEVLQVIGWTAILLDLILRPAFKLRLLDFFASVLAGGIGVVSLLFADWDFAVDAGGASRNPWIEFHAALSIFGYAVFAILALVSVMYLLQHYSLQRKKPSGVFLLLPSIRQLEEIASRLILIGVILLTLGVGIGFLNYLTLPSQVGLPKVLIATVVWAAYLIVLVLRRQKTLIAAPFAWACVLLFVLALLTLRPLTASREQADGVSAATVPGKEVGP